MSTGDDVATFSSTAKSYLFYYDAMVMLLAILANILVLIALAGGRMKAQKLFYRHYLTSLTCGGLFACSVNGLALVYPYIDRAAIGSSEGVAVAVKCLATIVNSLQLGAFMLALLNLAAMSIDHFTSVIYTVTYRNVMTDRKAITAIILLWLFSMFLALIDIPIAVIQQRTYSQETPSSIDGATTNLTDNESDRLLRRLANMLERLDFETEPASDAGGVTVPKPVKCSYLPSSTNMWLELIVMAIAGIAFVLLVVCYCSIFKKVGARRDANSSERTRKLILTTIMLILAFAICWIPFMMFEFVTLLLFNDNIGPNMDPNTSRALLNTQAVLSSLMQTYPLVDPIIYGARVPAIQEFYLKKFGVESKPSVRRPPKKAVRNDGVKQTVKQSPETSRNNVEQALEPLVDSGLAKSTL